MGALKNDTDVDDMKIEIGAPILEFYGETVRIGIEGKWVTFIARDRSMTRKQLMELIKEMDRKRTQ
jgi:hypothetical protein